MPNVMFKRLAKAAAGVAAVAVLAVPVAESAGAATLKSPFSPLTTFAAAGVPERPAYPQQSVLPVWPDNPADGSAAIGDIPYDEIAPKLNALQAASNRISARVAGKSSGGRDLYAVVVTAPETAAEAAQQGAWRQLIEDEPVRAREDAALLAGYKTPIFINGNIHGNEKEGTDAIVRVLEQYATAPIRRSRNCSSATSSSSTSRRTRTVASPTRAPTPRATTSTAT